MCSFSWIHTNVFIFKAVFNVADELLKTATQNPRLALHKAKAGWILLGALMTLGKCMMKVMYSVLNHYSLYIILFVFLKF